MGNHGTRSFELIAGLQKRGRNSRNTIYSGGGVVATGEAEGPASPTRKDKKFSSYHFRKKT